MNLSKENNFLANFFFLLGLKLFIGIGIMLMSVSGRTKECDNHAHENT